MNKYSMSQIDDMDFFWYLDLLIYQSTHKKKKKLTPIDQIF